MLFLFFPAGRVAQGRACLGDSAEPIGIFAERTTSVPRLAPLRGLRFLFLTAGCGTGFVRLFSKVWSCDACSRGIMIFPWSESSTSTRLPSTRVGTPALFSSNISSSSFIVSSVSRKLRNWFSRYSGSEHVGVLLHLLFNVPVVPNHYHPVAQILQRGTFRGVAGLVPWLVVVRPIAEDADPACPFPLVEEISFDKHTLLRPVLRPVRQPSPSLVELCQELAFKC